MRRWIGAAAAIVCAVLLGCGQSDAPPLALAMPDEARQGRLRLADKRDPNTLDPAHMIDAYDSTVAGWFHQGLVRFAPDSANVVPALAESWEWRHGEGEERLVVKLRANATFHDGATVSSWDVGYSLARLVDPAVASQRSWLLKPHVRGSSTATSGFVAEFVARAQVARMTFPITLSDTFSGIVLEDDRTVSIVLDEPFAPMLTMLAMPNAAIVPMGSFERGAFNDTPIGAGPWRLTSWKRGQRMEFVPAAEYWDGPPKLKSLTLRVFADQGAWREEFLAGNLDMFPLTPGEWRSWQKRPRAIATIVDVPEMNIYFIALRCQRPALRDARVRRALAMALDRRSLLRYVQHGLGALASGPVPPGVADRLVIDDQPFDPVAARALLSEAGANKLELTLGYAATSQHHEIMQVVASQWEAVGTTVNLRPLDRAAFNEARKRGDMDAYLGNWWADYPDADNFLAPLFHSRHIGGSNGTGFSSPNLDRILDQAQSSTDARDRARLYELAQLEIWEQSPMIFLWHRTSKMAVRPWVKGFAPHPMLNGNDLRGVWMQEQP